MVVLERDEELGTLKKTGTESEHQNSSKPPGGCFGDINQEGVPKNTFWNMFNGASEKYGYFLLRKFLRRKHMDWHLQGKGFGKKSFEGYSLHA